MVVTSSTDKRLCTADRGRRHGGKSGVAVRAEGKFATPARRAFRSEG